MPAPSVVPAAHDPLPHLLSLHNRSDAKLTAQDAAQMRASVLASSFARQWNLVQAAHRSHHHRELTLAPSPDDHIILPVGRPLQVRLGFSGTFREKPQEKYLGGEGVIVIPRGVTTRWQWRPHLDAETEPRAEFLHLYLRPDSFARVAEELEIASSAASLRETLSATDPALGRIGRLFYEEIYHNAAGSRLYADSLACSLAIHLLRGYAVSAAPSASAGRIANAPAPPQLTPKRLRLALDYIHSHLHTDIALADIAGVVGVSQYHFARLFKNAVGQAPHQYLISQRIEKAKRLLQTSDLSIGEIAHALGFDSHSRFTTQFRRHVGASPSEFRKR